MNSEEEEVMVDNAEMEKKETREEMKEEQGWGKKG